MQNSLIDQQGLFETKEYLLDWFNSYLCSILYLISVSFSDSQSGALRQDTQCLDSQARPNQHCPEKMGMISPMEAVSDVWLWGPLAPAFPRGSRPLAVFIGDSVRSPAACIPLPLPTQWWVSAAFLCLCPLSEMQPGLGKAQHSAKGLASRLTDSDGHVWVFSLNSSHL